MKKIILFIIIVISVITYFIWQGSNAVIIAKNYQFSHNDIDNLYDIEQTIANIIGSNVVNSKNDVLYNLVITSLQKDILLKNKVNLNKEENIKFIENSNNLKGVYKEAKKSLGDDKYYSLLIEPIAISKLFYKLYQLVEPAQSNAKKVLQLLKTKTQIEVAQLVNIKIINLNIPKNNKNLLKELKNLTGVYSKIIVLNDNLIVSNILGYDDHYIKTQSFVFKKLSYKNFLLRNLKKNNIKFPVYSFYNLDDIINKKGSILK